jgi:hypothetical protein
MKSGNIVRVETLQHLTGHGTAEEGFQKHTASLQLRPVTVSPPPICARNTAISVITSQVHHPA